MTNWIFALLFLAFLLVQGKGQTSEIVGQASYGSLSVSADELLSRYIQIPSISGQEEEAGLFLESLCREMGLFVRRFGDEQGPVNFSASLYPLEHLKPNLIFLNHMDVVPAGDTSGWVHPPFSGKVADGEIWGRGAFDNKGVAIMQLGAINQLIQQSQYQQWPFNVTFLSVSCEETQCAGGARMIAENHLVELNPWAIIGEGPPALEGVIQSNPGQLVFGIATGHKRSFWVELELAIHTSGHGSVTPLEYANKEMILALERLVSKNEKVIFTPENLGILKDLGRMEGGVKGFVLRHPRLFKALIVPQLRKQPEVFALFSNTITLTNLSNPTTAHNMIPEKTFCLLDCRLLPRTDEKAFEASLKKRLKREDIQVGVVLHMPQTSCTPVSHPAYEMLEQAILEYFGPETEVVPLLLPNFNDSGWFRARGVPVFDVTPVRMERSLLYCIHGNNERITQTALQEGIDVYTAFLHRLMASVE